MAGMDKEKTIRISVRNLVEFILREGDIDNRTVGSTERDAMLQGSRIHRRIQKRMGSAYRAEVPLKMPYPCDGFVLQVEGRADGVLQEKEGAVIDEIKAVVRDISSISEPVPVHLAQAKCYAYMYAVQEQLEKIGVQMTYCQMETEEVRRFRFWYSVEELKLWFHKLAASYEKWAKFQIQWKEKRDTSIRSMEFPFPYREGQRQLTVSVYRTILRKKKLFIQAPTGVGKTMAVVFPAVRAVGEGLGEKVFYLTARTITRTVAEQAFFILRKEGLQYKTVTLTAKEKICFCEETQCNPDACPYAKGHFDRVNDAVYELVTTCDGLTREVLERQAQKYRVCPFELALDVSVWADALICDYNYAFDPTARLKRFFCDNVKGGYIFLIDEAHNLVERGREMYSAELYKEDILNIRRLVKTEDVKLAKCLEECNRQFLELKKECENYLVLTSISHIALKLMHALGELERYLEESREEEKREAVLNFYFQIRDFLNIYDMLDEHYVIYSELESNGRFKLKLFCVSPAANLHTCLEQGNSTIFFSATLLPVNYYKKLLSLGTEDYAVYADSPFPKENCCLLVGTDVSTRYKERNINMYRRFARYIHCMVKARLGNYLVFFPSYHFMEAVYQCFSEEEEEDNIECIMQSQYMGEEAREIFLETFEEERKDTLVGFCVMGGIFSEGIDLTKDRLIGAVIIGTGVPQVCNEREILRKYFDQKGMPGFDFAYLYPGMNKVLQSAGRVIRTEEDRGVVLLLDERFLSRQYQEIFPREWSEWKSCRLVNVEEKIRDYWKSAARTDKR